MTVLSLTWESLCQGKMVFILREGKDKTGEGKDKYNWKKIWSFVSLHEFAFQTTGTGTGDLAPHWQFLVRHDSMTPTTHAYIKSINLTPYVTGHL